MTKDQVLDAWTVLEIMHKSYLAEVAENRNFRDSNSLSDFVGWFRSKKGVAILKNIQTE